MQNAEKVEIGYTLPKELAQFDGLRETRFGFEPRQLERPPQSWCYVEGMKHDLLHRMESQNGGGGCFWYS